MLGNLLLAHFKGALFFFPVFRYSFFIRRRGQPQNRAQRRHNIPLGHFVYAGGADAIFRAAGSVHNDMLPILQLQIPGIKIVNFPTGAEVDVHNPYGVRCGGGLFRLFRYGGDIFFFHSNSCLLQLDVICHNRMDNL